MKRMQWFGGWRRLLLQALGWVHCAMLYGLFYGMVFQILQGDGVLPGRLWCP